MPWPSLSATPAGRTGACPDSIVAYTERKEKNERTEQRQQPQLRESLISVRQRETWRQFFPTVQILEQKQKKGTEVVRMYLVCRIRGAWTLSGREPNAGVVYEPVYFPSVAVVAAASYYDDIMSLTFI